MTPAATVSVIVASRRRGRDLHRCLTGIAQQDHPAFEVIVVGDAVALAVADGRPVKRVANDEPNLSLARNLGLMQAAGTVVAFIDDDAVPAPGWLRALCAPFDDPDVVAAGGAVLRDGWLRREWVAGTTDAEGVTTPLRVTEDGTTILRGTPGRAIAVLGTNMAFRRDHLARAGGFDPAFRYYLDETDLCLRLSGQGFAIVPAARVFHAPAASAVRGPGGALRDASEIGASQAVLLRKHCPESQRAGAGDRFLLRMRARLIRQMVNGLLEPGEIVPVMETLSAGIRAGLQRQIRPLAPIGAAQSPFLPHPPACPEVAVLSGRTWQRGALLREARRRVADNLPVVVLTLGPSAIFHRVSYMDPGVWFQRGGLFGRADRGDPLLRLVRFGRRVAEEAGRWNGGSRES